MARKYKTFAEVPTALPSVLVSYHSKFSTRVCCECDDGKYRYYATLRHGDFVQFLARHLDVQRSSSLDKGGRRQETTKEKVVGKLVGCTVERYVVSSSDPVAGDKAPFSMMVCLDDLKRHRSFKGNADFGNFYQMAREMAATVCRKVESDQSKANRAAAGAPVIDPEVPGTLPEAPVAPEKPPWPESGQRPSSTQELLESIKKPLLDHIAALQEQLQSQVDWPAEILAVYEADPVTRVELWKALAALASIHSKK